MATDCSKPIFERTPGEGIDCAGVEFRRLGASFMKAVTFQPDATLGDYFILACVVGLVGFIAYGAIFGDAETRQIVRDLDAAKKRRDMEDQ